jgi:hypothetical protein
MFQKENLQNMTSSKKFETIKRKLTRENSKRLSSKEVLKRKTTTSNVLFKVVKVCTLLWQEPFAVESPFKHALVKSKNKSMVNCCSTLRGIISKVKSQWNIF